MPKLSVRKSIHIQASPEKVFLTVRDFNQWRPWSPWILMEPDCPTSVNDNGDHYSWDGKVIGTGSMTVLDEKPNEHIHYQLEFVKPWKSKATVDIFFEAKDGGTQVTWTNDGSIPVFIFFLKNMMNALIGMDYNRGLLMLKDYIELDHVPSEVTFEGIQTHPSFHFIGVRANCPIDSIDSKMEESFTKVINYLKSSGRSIEGNGLTLYHNWDIVKERTDFSAGFQVSSIPDDLPDDFVSGTQPSTDCYTILHKGPYRHLANGWSAGMCHSQSKVFKGDKKKAPFEFYESGPSSLNNKDVEEKDYLTRICIPAKV